MTPGLGLAAELGSVDRAAVAAEELPELVRARARLVAWLQAELLLDLVEAAHGMCADPGSTERYDDDERVDSAVVELGWVLRWSGSWTASQVGFGQALVARLPSVLEALRSGRIDRERAFAFVDALACVEDAVAQRIVAKLLVKAEDLTVGELRERLRYHIDRADPQAKRRRYRKSVAGRGVWLRGNDDGTANLAGVNLPPHRAAAAFDRVDRLARSARQDGDVRNLAQLRADAFTDLLCGAPFRLCPSVDPVSAQADAEHPLADPAPSDPGPPKRLTPRPRVDPRSAYGHGTSHDSQSGEPAGAPAGERGARRPARDEPAAGRESEAGRESAARESAARESDARHEPAGRIDLYDYEDQCLTDEDRWWLSRLRIHAPGGRHGGTAVVAHDPTHPTRRRSAARRDRPASGGCRDRAAGGDWATGVDRATGGDRAAHRDRLAGGDRRRGCAGWSGFPVGNRERKPG